MHVTAQSVQTVDRRVRKTKQGLVRALLALMDKRHFREITIADIVREADVNRGTFYRYYRHKEELLEDAIDTVIKDLIEAFREPYKNCDTFTPRDITASSIKIFDHVAQYANFYTLIAKSHTLPVLYERIYDQLKKLYMHDFTICDSDAKIDKEIYASYQANAVIGMILDWIRGGFRHSPSYMAEQLQLILHFEWCKAVYRTNRNPDHRR